MEKGGHAIKPSSNTVYRLSPAHGIKFSVLRKGVMK